MRAHSRISLLVLALLEELRTVHLQQVYFLTYVDDFGVDHVQSLLILVLTLNINLHEKFPALLLLREFDSVHACRLLLSAHFNRRVDIENGLLSCVLNRQELFDLDFLVLLDVAVEKQCCVVFVVVDVG